MKTFIFVTISTNRIIKITAASVEKAKEQLYFEHGISSRQANLVLLSNVA